MQYPKGLLIFSGVILLLIVILSVLVLTGA